jgi:hypothetical protein
MASKYSIYHGKFPCHTCQEVVTSLRFYVDDKMTTWMCSKKHLTQVSMYAKKSKKDYEREIRD